WIRGHLGYIPAVVREPTMLIRPLVAAALAALFLALPATATTVLNLSQAQVDELAQRIIEGRCVESRVVTLPDTSLSATEYVFQVERVLKGAVKLDGGRLVIRQVGSTGGEDGKSRSFMVVGMPRYEVGQRYRLALNGDSQLGLTSPVGFGQGVTRLPEPAAAKP